MKLFTFQHFTNSFLVNPNL
ncbi:hypothetical protein F383_23197 [Gossypium arboreum]|uniref:Uncharacterized protein n=1 Tax=Gossypium arboreum TaxID=29729 RepID=A0A0B0NT96_GOSAR|nr:hypothetical protein F383_23197 [Gossypium arboreum]